MLFKSLSPIVSMLAAAALFPRAALSQTACATPDGLDLSPLTNPSGYDVSYQGFSYRFNICAPVPGACAGRTGVSVCQAMPNGLAQYSCGDLAFQTIERGPDESLVITYKGGDDGRFTVVTIYCAPNAPVQPTDWTISENTEMEYTLLGSSSIACRSPTPSPTPTTSPTPSKCSGPDGRDLSFLSGGQFVAVGQDGMARYWFSLCGALPERCGASWDSAVCSNAVSYGEYDTQFIAGTVGQYTFYYSRGANGGTAAVQISCNRDSPAVPSTWKVFRSVGSSDVLIAGESHAVC